MSKGPKLTGLRNLNLSKDQAGQEVNVPAAVNTKDVAGVFLFADARFTPSDFDNKTDGPAAEKNVFDSEISESRKGSHAEDVIQTLSELANATSVGKHTEINNNNNNNNNNNSHINERSSVALVAPALPQPGGSTNTLNLKRHTSDSTGEPHTQPHKFRKLEAVADIQGGNLNSSTDMNRDNGMLVVQSVLQDTQPYANNSADGSTTTSTSTRGKKPSAKSKKALTSVKPSSLSAEDAAARRRELNRLAAQKCRKKRDDEIEKLEKVLATEEKANHQLKESVASLSQEIIRIRRELEKHAGCMPDR